MNNHRGVRTWLATTATVIALGISTFLNPLSLPLASASPDETNNSNDLAEQLLERYADDPDLISSSIASNSSLVNALSTAWDARIRAEAAEEVAVIAEEEHQEALEEERKAREFAAEKDAEADELALEALEAHNAQRRSAAGSGLSPEITAFSLGPTDLQGYIRGTHAISSLNEQAANTAETANNASIEADLAHEEAQRSRNIADLALEIAANARQEADELEKEAQTLLDEAQLASHNGSLELVEFDAQQSSSNVSGPELSLAAAAKEWYEVEGDTEGVKPRGQDAVYQQWDEITAEVQEQSGQRLEAANRTSRDPIRPASQEDLESTSGVEIAKEAVDLLGSRVSSENVCTDSITSLYDTEHDSLSELVDAYQSIPLQEAALGDALFFTAPDDKLTQVGVYMGAGLAVVPSLSQGIYMAVEADKAEVAVRIGQEDETETEYEDSDKWVCGHLKPAPMRSGILWNKPFEDYEVTEAYSSSHPYLNIERASSNDILYAPQAGVIKIEDDGVVIQSPDLTIHLSGVEEDNLVVKLGDYVRAGHALGVADEVILSAVANERPFDPNPLLTGEWLTERNEDDSESESQPSEGGSENTDWDSIERRGENSNNLFNRAAFEGVPESESAAHLPVDFSAATKTSSYGPRVPPIPGAYPFHAGVDYGAPVGTELYSVLDGVVWATYSDDNSGNQIIIQYTVNGTPYAAVYKHLHSHPDQFVSEGDIVEAGDVIGTVGSTGHFSTGPHLHFEVWEGTFNKEYHIDPVAWMRNIGLNVN